MNRDFIFKAEEELLTQVIKFFFASILDKEHFRAVVSICLKNPEVANTSRRHLIEQGKFSMKDYLYHLSAMNPQGVAVSMAVEVLLERFCSFHLLHRSQLLASYGLDYYQVNEPAAKFFLDRDALENLAFDFTHLVEKYSDSILHLVIEDANGDCWGGTGFLFMTRQMVITNKHVVEEDVSRKPRVLTKAGRELPVKRFYISPSMDLAFGELEAPLEARPLFPSSEISPLDDIVTMGYPRIPFATSSPMVAHRGELNGRISLVQGEFLLFSAKTAPGNSGGPLLDRAGLVVGVVTKELQTQMAEETGIQPYFAAIPITQMMAFMKEIFPSLGNASK